MELFTLASLHAWTGEMLKTHPERAGYHIEIWNLLLARLPTRITHDDGDRVVILGSVPVR